MSVNEADRAGIAAAPLFRGVDVAAIPGLWERGLIRSDVPAGTLLLSPDVENRSVYLILDGEVDVHLGVPGPSPDRRLGPGHCLGELSLLDGQRPSASVIAATPLRLFVLDEEIVWSAVEASYGFARNLLYILCGRTRSESAALGAAQRARQELERTVRTDALTGLRNRRWMAEAFPRQLERSVLDHQPVSLLMLDLDGFKSFNDTHGHLGGDVALRASARVFEASLRPGDLLARYGGEEFVVLLPGADLRAALEAAERLRAAVEKAVLVDDDGGPLPSITVSIGAAETVPGETMEAVIERADRALYCAKDGGRNRVHV